jgi:transcriptional regulator GlxA family with amidase domain
MSVFRHPDRHRVAVLVRDGVVPLELGSVSQLFGSAQTAEGTPLYEVVTCAIVPGVVRTDCDYSINVMTGPEALLEADTVILPASMEQDQILVPGGLAPELADALRNIRPDARIASICTAAFVLAAAGLLNGHKATTHWKTVHEFVAAFPDIPLEPSVLYTDGGNILTAAGQASGIDLCLHMIRRDHGSIVANAVARYAVVPPHRDGGQAQYIPRPVSVSTATSANPTRDWALKNLGDELTLNQLAAHSQQSVRTFTRRFRDEMGVSAMTWLTQQRVEHARMLLEESDLAIDQVAAKAGFGSAASLRQHLQAAIGLSPSAYRATFADRPERAVTV